MGTYITDLRFENVWGMISNQLELANFEFARTVEMNYNPGIDFTPTGTSGQILPGMIFPYEKIVSILYGQNGSGKTTSMRLISAITELATELLEQYKEGDLTDWQKSYEDLVKYGQFPQDLVSSEKPNHLVGKDMSDNEIISNLTSLKSSGFDISLSGLHQSQGIDFKFKIILGATKDSAVNYLHPAINQIENYSGGKIYYLHLELEKMSNKAVSTEFTDLSNLPTIKFEALSDLEVKRENYHSETNVLPFIITDDKKAISLPPYYCSWFNLDNCNLEPDEVDWSREVIKEKYLERVGYEQVHLDQNREVLATHGELTDFIINRFPLVPNESFHSDLLDEYDFWYLGEYSELGDLMEVSEYFLPFREVIEGISTSITNISDLKIRIEPLNEISKSTTRIKSKDLVAKLMLPMSILFMNEGALQRMIANEPQPEIWTEFDDEQKLFHHLQSCFVGFQKLIDAGFNPQENDSLEMDSDWIIENCEEICEIVLSIKEYFLLRTYEKGVQFNRARKEIFQQYGDTPLFDKSKLSYSFEDWNFLDVIDLCRSHLELIHSYLIPNYRIHTKNEFTRELIERYTGVSLKTIYVNEGRTPKLTINNLDVKFDDLSSGQKRIIQLITALLSNELKGPIMIDEPEISLHPKWLTELKDIITNCIEYSRRQVIICTHSPELVYLFDNAIPIENFPKDEE